MNFLIQVRDSIYNPLFYRALFERTFGFSLSYYGKLAAVLALLLAVFFAIAVVPDLNRGLWQLEKVVLEAFPDELELELARGRLAKNIAEPVVIPLPAEWAAALPAEEIDREFDHLIVIDTTSPATLAAYEEKGAVVLVTAEALIAPADARGTIQIEPYAAEASFSLSEAKLAGFFAAVRPWYVLVAPVVVLGIFVAVMFLMFILLLPLSIVALFVWALLRLMARQVGRRAAFGEAYRLTLHAVTLPLIAFFFLTFIWDGIFGPALFAALTLLIVFLNFTDLLPSPPAADLSN